MSALNRCVCCTRSAQGRPFLSPTERRYPLTEQKARETEDARNIMTNQCTKTLRGATLPLGGEREDLRNFLRLVLQLPAIWEPPLPDGQALGIQYHPGTTLLLRASARALSLALHLRLTLLLLALAAARSLLRRVMLALIACVAPGSLPPPPAAGMCRLIVCFPTRRSEMARCSVWCRVPCAHLSAVDPGR